MIKRLGFFKGALVALAMVGVVFPQARLLADQKSPTQPIVRVVAENSTLDVRLGQGGTFTGRAVDHNGNPIQGAKVVLRQGKRDVGHCETDENGRFAVANLKSGVHLVSSGATEGIYRLWSEKTAPPAAKTQGVLVLGENGARGQYGCCCDDGSDMLLCAGLLVAGVAVAALVIAIIANNKSDDDPAPAPHSP
ncbi:MAG: carboxypeptidase regulatory-like domain-containing protein [Planctomycetota bacterium]|nr:MAG: carboxypeptidase regulatory-like domain-containing protein [Planctomycetota bacterium]